MELVYCTMLYHVYSNMGASTNGGTPQCRWCRMENRSINGRFGGIPILGNRNYMEVVYITWLFISVGLTSKKLHAMGNFRLYGRYLQSRFLKWPLKYYNYWFQYVWLQRHYSMCLTLHLELRPKLDFTELKAGWIFSGETEKKNWCSTWSLKLCTVEKSGPVLLAVLPRLKRQLHAFLRKSRCVCNACVPWDLQWLACYHLIKWDKTNQLIVNASTIFNWDMTNQLDYCAINIRYKRYHGWIHVNSITSPKYRWFISPGFGRLVPPSFPENFHDVQSCLRVNASPSEP